MLQERIVVFDTTLRDGEQAPGFSMDVPTKLLGLSLTGEELAEVYRGVITMAARRKSIGDGDLRRIVGQVRKSDGALA